MKQDHKVGRPQGRSLLPFLFFIGLYLGIGLYLTVKKTEMAFYQFPILLAALIGIFSAFILHKGDMTTKLNALVRGMGHEDIMIMCMIYLLAGAFSASTDAIGAVKSTVNLALSYVPANFLIAGMFLIAAFLSLALGSSMGTIGAVAPIAVRLAVSSHLNLYLMVGAVLGGAMFGDNLSVISDTTIAATRSQGVEMRDKFRLNFKIALPAALLTLVLLVIFGRPETLPKLKQVDYSLIKVLPYLFVLVSALAGLNVFLVLAGGVALSGIIGLATGSISFIAFSKACGDGMLRMSEIFILSILVGGLAAMCRDDGGFDWLIAKLSQNVRSSASAQLAIASIVSVADLASANNTVAIIISGPIARDLSYRYRVDPRRSASLLDAASCVFQGLIPYGAQMLLIVSTTASVVGLSLNPLAIIPNTWYCLFLLGFLLLSMWVPYADGALKKDPWDWTHACKQSQRPQD